MEPIGNILPKRINKLGLQKTLEASFILAKADEYGKGRFKAIRFSRGVLTLSCPNSIVSSELRLSQEQIIAGLNQSIKRPLIKHLTFRIKD